LPSAAPGKGFAECKVAFAGCIRHPAKRLNPVVASGVHAYEWRWEFVLKEIRAREDYDGEHGDAKAPRPDQLPKDHTIDAPYGCHLGSAFPFVIFVFLFLDAILDLLGFKGVGSKLLAEIMLANEVIAGNLLAGP